MQTLPVTKRQWRQKYLGAKRSQYRTVGPGKRGSQTRLRQANDLREIRAGKRYKFKKG